MFSVGLAILIADPVLSSCKNNNTVLVIEFKANKPMITILISHFNLLNLSLWLFEINTGPIVMLAISVTVTSITQYELILYIQYFINLSEILIVAQLVRGRELSILNTFDWLVCCGQSILEFGWDGLCRLYLDGLCRLNLDGLCRLYWDGLCRL